MGEAAQNRVDDGRRSAGPVIDDRQQEQDRSRNVERHVDAAGYLLQQCRAEHIDVVIDMDRIEMMRIVVRRAVSHVHGGRRLVAIEAEVQVCAFPTPDEYGGDDQPDPDEALSAGHKHTWEYGKAGVSVGSAGVEDPEKSWWAAS
jgi:hypothetical protein